MKFEDYKPLTIREKIVMKLVILIIQMLKPYEYEYQFKEAFRALDGLIMEKEAK
jgi:hypothetical protein